MQLFQVGTLVKSKDNWLLQGQNIYLHEMGYRFPIKDNIYTIREVNRIDGYLSILLEELKNPMIETIDAGFCEVGFDPNDFEILQQPTDLIEKLFNYKPDII